MGAESSRSGNDENDNGDKAPRWQGLCGSRLALFDSRQFLALSGSWSDCALVCDRFRTSFASAGHGISILSAVLACAYRVQRASPREQRSQQLLGLSVLLSVFAFMALFAER